MGIGGNMQPFEDYADAPRGEHEEQPLKNGESSSEIVLPKCKHPKMYHIRDFPGGGGPNAAPIDAIVASGKSKAGRFSRQADLEANPTEYSVTDTESLNKDNTALTRKYPPRRKNSAISDFPAFCGRDARRPTKEEYIRMGLGHLHEEMLAKDAEATNSEQHEVSTIRNFQKYTSKYRRDKFTAGDSVKASCLRDANHLNRKPQTYGKKPDIEDRVEVKVRKETAVYGVKVGKSEGKMSNEVAVHNKQVRGVQRNLGNKVVLHKQNSVQKYPSVFLGDNRKTPIQKAAKHKSKLVDFEEGDEECEDLRVARGSSSHLHRQPQAYGKEPNIEDCVEVKVRKETAVCGVKVEKSKGKMSNEVAVHKEQVRGVQRNLGNKVVLHKQNNVQKYSSGIFGSNIGTKQLGRESLNRKSPPIQKVAHHKRKLQVDVEEADEEREDHHIARSSYDFKGNVASLVQRSSLSGHSNIYSIRARNKVRDTLRYFQVVIQKLLQEREAASMKGQPAWKRVELAAANIVKSEGKYVNIGESILGTVPGVEVGDEFRYRVELAMVGLHRPTQGGIDYVRRGTKIFATSVVASRAYANDLSKADQLTYSGSGGNIATGYKKKLKPVDQKLERGNLAMKNSADENRKVRVIRAYQNTKNSGDTYTYDGLYTVDGYWPERGQHDNLFFKFHMVRVAGQPKLTWNEVNKSKESKVSDEKQDICHDPAE